MSELPPNAGCTCICYAKESFPLYSLGWVEPDYIAEAILTSLDEMKTHLARHM